MTTRWPITGVGAVSSVGRTSVEMFDNLCAGRSGQGPMKGFTADWYTARDLYEVDDRVDGADRPLRATGFLLDAVAEALAAAGLSDDLGEIPVLVGTGLREHRSAELWRRDGAEVSPGDLYFGTALRRRFGAVNTHTFANACSASLYALSLATDLLAAGEADTVVVAGTDSVTESMFGVADRLQMNPPDTVRPFDANRLGTILGEGASAVVLRRDSEDRPLGWVRGVAVNCDAGHPTAPDPTVIAACMREAHTTAGVAPTDIDLVMLHGTGTIANDVGESQAVREVYGTASKVPAMTSLKSMTGHTSGASGLHSLVSALHSMSTGRIPPTISLDEPIEEVAEFRIVRGGAATERVRLAQINAFGFGGLNAVAIVEEA